VPEITIRELVGQCAHPPGFPHDGASMMVEIYSDRVDIFHTPVSQLCLVERFIDGYQSATSAWLDLMRRMRILRREEQWHRLR